MNGLLTLYVPPHICERGCALYNISLGLPRSPSVSQARILSHEAAEEAERDVTRGMGRGARWSDLTGMFGIYRSITLSHATTTN